MAPSNTDLAKFQPKTFELYVKEHRAALQQAAAEQSDVRRLYRLIVNCVSQTPKLQQCTIASLFRALQQAAELNLEPGSALGEAYLVPYQDQCQLIVGYRGLIALARRSGEVETIQAFCVYDEDEIEIELGLNPILRHVPKFSVSDPKRIQYAYAIARLKGGISQFDVMTRAEIEAVRSRSRAGNNGPWVTDWPEMARKTTVRRLVKYLPMSIQMARAVEIDTQSEFGDRDTSGAVVATPAIETAAEENPLDLDITEEEQSRASQQTMGALSR